MHHLPATTVAKDAGVFDALCEAPLSVDELAKQLSLNARSLSIVMAMLAALNLVVRREGRFHPTAATRAYLWSKSEYYWGPLFLSYKENSPIHSQLMKLLKSGDAGQTDRPSDGWAAGEIGPDAAQFIAKFMHAHSLPTSVAAARSSVFSGIKKFLGIGGGSGVFAIAAAQRDDGLQATIMDLNTMCDAAQSFIDAGGVGDRVDTRAVDMFREDWPTGYDALFFSNIFHDGNEATNLELAKSRSMSCRRAGASSSTKCRWMTRRAGL